MDRSKKSITEWEREQRPEERSETGMRPVRILRVILCIIVFFLAAFLIWFLPITVWWQRLIVALIAVALIVLFH